ncbi:EAL domain-containing protein [Acidithiobacillus thiooxidans]|nr:EAL domain-containing protein [Acidithiobacillus thiooxidans]
MAETMVLYNDIARDLATDQHSREREKTIIATRLQYDLISQMGAYAQVQKNRLTVYAHIEQQQTDHLLDFLQQTLKSLLESLGSEIMGVALGNVKDNTYRHLLCEGKMPWLTGGPHAADHPIKVAPEFQQAWIDEQALMVNNLHQETQLPSSFQGECQSLGIRSVGLFVMHDQQGRPQSLLLVCGRFPGYFLSEETGDFWQKIADLIGRLQVNIGHSSNPRQHRLSDEIHFRQLLAKGKVEMYYQPIVDPNTGRTVKVEALARLCDGGSIISPGKFLPAFGIPQLRALFDTGLARIREYLIDLNVPCTINLPTEIMADTRWLKLLPEYLTGIGLDAQRIGLEILESSLTDHPDICQALFVIREAQYPILLDDVGAGESSLLRLSTLPISGIKIDQRFVRSLQQGFENLDLILALRMITLQRGLDCIIEGVENSEIVDTLSCIPTVLHQGYFYSKPMTITALAEWMACEVQERSLEPLPKTLYGWYGCHVRKELSIRDALYTIPDLINIDALQNAEMCPLHGIIHQIGGGEELVQLHQEWHLNYAQAASQLQSGFSMDTLREDLDATRNKLRTLIERKIGLRPA